MGVLWIACAHCFMPHAHKWDSLLRPNSVPWNCNLLLLISVTAWARRFGVQKMRYLYFYVLPSIILSNVSALLALCIFTDNSRLYLPPFFSRLHPISHIQRGEKVMTIFLFWGELILQCVGNVWLLRMHNPGYSVHLIYCWGRLFGQSSPPPPPLSRYWGEQESI